MAITDIPTDLLLQLVLKTCLWVLYIHSNHFDCFSFIVMALCKATKTITLFVLKAEKKNI